MAGLRSTHGGGFADRKYKCRKHGAGIVHDPACRVSRPVCRWRRQVCRCSAVPWPHRPGSMRGCREGGVPEAILQSRSYQRQSREHGGFGNSSRRQRVMYRGFEIRSVLTSHRGQRIYEAGIRAPNGRIVDVAYDRTRPLVVALSQRKIDRLLAHADVSRFPPFVVQYRNREGQARSLSAYDVKAARRLLRKAKKIDPRATLHGEA